MEQETAVATRQSQEVSTAVLGQAARLEEIKQRLVLLDQFYSGVMTRDIDYGIIQGTKKPTLLKPGGELLCLGLNLAAMTEIQEEKVDWDQGFFFYQVAVTLQNKTTGIVEGVGLGSCNSKEARYRNRWVWPGDVPDEINKSTLKKKEWERRDGGIATQYLLENDSPWDLGNTILKMATKRAFIDAVLRVTGASRIFGQDVEDFAGGLPLEPDAPAANQPKQERKAKAEPDSQQDRNKQLYEVRKQYADLTGKALMLDLEIKPLPQGAPLEVATKLLNELTDAVNKAMKAKTKDAQGVAKEENVIDGVMREMDEIDAASEKPAEAPGRKSEGKGEAPGTSDRPEGQKGFDALNVLELEGSEGDPVWGWQNQFYHAVCVEDPQAEPEANLKPDKVAGLYACHKCGQLIRSPFEQRKA